MTMIMKLRGENQSQGAPMGIEKRISSRAAHPCCAALKGERGNKSGMKWRRSDSRSRRRLRSGHLGGAVPAAKEVWSTE
jgi:hypothetical protein